MKHDAPYYIKQCMSNQNTIDAQNVILKLDNTINFPKYPQFAYISLFVSPWCYIGIDLWPIFGLKKYSSSCEVGSFLYKFIWQIYSLKTNISGVSEAECPTIPEYNATSSVKKVIQMTDGDKNSNFHWILKIVISY